MKKIGLQLYSIKHMLFADLEGTLKKVREMGYDAVEFFGGFSFPAERIVKALKEADLEICGWHTGWDALSDGSLYATIAYFQAVGNKSVVVPGLPPECTASIEAWKNTAKEFSRIANILKEYGMTLGYHNHFAEFIDMDGVKPVDAFLAEACPSVNWQFDLGNAMHSKQADPVAFLETYPEREKTVHCKPYSKTKEFDCVIGQDDIDWNKVVELVEKNPVTEYYIVEYEIESNEYQGCKDCYDGLAKVVKAKG